MSSVRGYAELEIRVGRIDADVYHVELRFDAPGSDAEIPPVRGPVSFDLGRLLAVQVDPPDYGARLAAQLFHDAGIRQLYGRARAAAEAAGEFLRLRLTVGPSAVELHSLRWELLRDPESREPLATSEKTPFSRFMVSHDWRPVKLRPRAELTALVAVAAPSDPRRYQLAEVDRDGEIERATRALDGIAVTVAGRDEPLTLDRLCERLRDGNGRRGVDVLYLVCHGALVRHSPRLYLQDESGNVVIVDGNDLAQRIAEMARVPRLVVLASCEGAAPSRDDRSAESSLALRLARAGVPAIVAMQGKISVATLTRMMPVFFKELLRDGQIDRAMAVARGAVRDRHDAWMPALYLRLKSGRIWYEPGFTGEGTDFEKWKSICRRVRRGQFIPILGYGLGEHVFGSLHDLAVRMAEANGFPLEIHHRSDLPKVIQFLSVNQDRAYAQDEVFQQLRRAVLENHRDVLDDGARRLPLPALLEHVGERCRRAENDPYRILSQLPASVYITATPETVVYKSLKAAGRQPAMLCSHWRPTETNHPAEPPYDGVPTLERPVVYHVFGTFGEPDSLVMTEDDFFDYLIAASAYKLIPTVVRGSLTESTLLFLGFQLNDWTFRVLFRLIMTMEGCAELKRFSHVGVQVDPEEHSLADVEQARRYLESYFGTDRSAGHGRGEPRIDIYWGTAAAFLDELRLQLDRTQDEDEPAAVACQEDGGGWF